VTAEIGRIFCPKCGNGGTLRKVAVTVGENGVVLADRRPRITLRGTKVSISICVTRKNFYGSYCSLVLLVSG
jgi:RNA-binding protein NOB1